MTGPAVVAPNHKSFFDSFVVAAALPRRSYGMGKAELFDGPAASLFLALGGFPVRRGESDADALETARLLLRRGELVTVFPEGTRVAGADVLGTPKRGAARLAIETRSPVVPVAISGMEKRQLPLPRRVTVAFGAPVDVTGLEATPEGAGQLIAETVWPRVEEDYRRLLARPGVVATSLAAAAVAFAVVRHRRRS